ncbi:hypothetical protein Bca101_082746 [Brassica carinata]
MVLNRRSTRRLGQSTTSSARRTSIPEGSSPVNSDTEELSLNSIHSPYHLISSVNPGLSIVISEVLDGTNYDNWSIAMNIALDAKNKLAFIDGSVVRPLESHVNLRIWSRCNSMVKSWLLNSVSKKIYKSILRFNDASEIWKDLQTRFHITNLPRSYQLSQQILSLQQGSMDLATDPEANTIATSDSLAMKRDLLSPASVVLVDAKLKSPPMETSSIFTRMALQFFSLYEIATNS